jgi:WXG100 family type VII secretion target
MAQGTNAVSADMRSTATEVDNLNRETQSELSRLQSEAQSLRGNWQSSRSGRSFDQTMAQWNQDAAAIQRALQDIARLMRASADRYDGVEEQNVAATRIGGDPSRTYSI